MLIDLSGLLLGLIGLWLGTEWAVNSAITIAEHYNLSELFLGMGVLAIGSDLPELAVAIDAGIKNSQGLAVSDLVVGSSIGSAFAQIGLVLGLTGLTGYLIIGRIYLIRHGSMLLGSILILWLLSYDGNITRFDGIVLLIVFAIYFSLLLEKESPTSQVEKRKTTGLPITWFKLFAGIATVIASSELTVFSTISFAERIEIPQAVIAIIIVGIGTSLPELSISIAAVRKKKGALSVGNILGSNIFDTLIPIGVSALIFPVSISRQTLFFHLPALAGFSALVLLFFLYKKGLQRREAYIILAVYACFITVQLVTS